MSINLFEIRSAASISPCTRQAASTPPSIASSGSKGISSMTFTASTTRPALPSVSAMQE
uniref:Uncharacterized protein n=1 Tax=Arundo donax TaxID=35708 RepID=A0A0A8YN77_ARUDO